MKNTSGIILVLALFVSCDKSRVLDEGLPAGKAMARDIVTFHNPPRRAVEGERFTFKLSTGIPFDHKFKVPVRILDAYCNSEGNAVQVVYDSRTESTETYTEVVEYSYYPRKNSTQPVNPPITTSKGTIRHKIIPNTKSYPQSCTGDVDCDGDGDVDEWDNPGADANKRAPCEEMLLRTNEISDNVVEFVCGRTYHRQNEDIKYSRKAVFEKGELLSKKIGYRPKDATGTGTRLILIVIEPGPGYLVGNAGENRIRIGVSE